MSYPGCGCGNWWSNAPQSICGSFELPDGAVEDQGQCSPYRVKITCEAPTLPVAGCSDDTYEVVYQPEDIEHPFIVLSKLFDSLCDVITDDSGDPITTVVA
jgi:hypothetical protein